MSGFIKEDIAPRLGHLFQGAGFWKEVPMASSL